MTQPGKRAGRQAGRRAGRQVGRQVDREASKQESFQETFLEEPACPWLTEESQCTGNARPLINLFVV